MGHILHHQLKVGHPNHIEYFHNVRMPEALKETTRIRHKAFAGRATGK